MGRGLSLLAKSKRYEKIRLTFDTVLLFLFGLTSFVVFFVIILSVVGIIVFVTF